jgi:hypothetical protein
MSPVGLRTGNHCAGNDQQQFISQYQVGENSLNNFRESNASVIVVCVRKILLNIRQSRLSSENQRLMLKRVIRFSKYKEGATIIF